MSKASQLIIAATGNKQFCVATDISAPPAFNQPALLQKVLSARPLIRRWGLAIVVWIETKYNRRHRQRTLGRPIELRQGILLLA